MEVRILETVIPNAVARDGGASGDHRAIGCSRGAVRSAAVLLRISGTVRRHTMNARALIRRNALQTLALKNPA